MDPDPHLTRAVNSALRVSAPATPNSLKRKAAAMVDLEEDETEKAKRTKIMQYMNPLSNASRKPFHPRQAIVHSLTCFVRLTLAFSYKILNLMSMVEKKREEAKHPPRGQVTNNMGPLPTQSNGLGTASASTPANAIVSYIRPILFTFSVCNVHPFRLRLLLFPHSHRSTLQPCCNPQQYLNLFR